MTKVRTSLNFSALAVALSSIFFSGVALADEENAEGGIGIGYWGRLSIQASGVDVGPGRDDAGVLTSQSYESSTPIKLGFDMAALPFPSINGNPHGFEFGSSISVLPFDMDIWGGTAYTMLRLGSGGVGTIRLRGGFGMGMSMNHAYFYLRSQLAAVIVPGKVSAEAGVFWIPNQVSHAWGEQEGDFEEQRRRASVYIDLGKDSRKIELYAEQIDRQRGGHGEDFMADREDFTNRDPDDDMLGLGLGASLMLTF